MKKNLQVLFVLLAILSMMLSACAPAAVEVEPTVAQVPTAEPTEAVLDVDATLAALWGAIPADAGYGTVAAAKLNEELADKAPFLLDVREASEATEVGYIAGSVNIPVRDLLKNLDKLPAYDQPIVIYCASGHRGGMALAALRMLGYGNVRNLGGGIGAWNKAELPLVKDALAAPAAISTPIVADELLFTTLSDFFATLPETFYTVKADALNTMLAEKAPVLVDVRSQAEITKDGYIEGSIAIPFSDFLASGDKLPADKAAPVVIYCASGHRGAIAMMAMRMMGYTDVVNLAGGLGAWKAAKLPVAGAVDWPATFGEFLAALPADQGFYSVAPAKLNEMLADQPPFILDVREASEVEATGYILGSVHIPVRDVLKNLNMLPAQDQKIVITCASGHRGAMIMMALRLLGYTDVVNLGGGIGGWAKAELALEPGLPAAAVAGEAPAVDAARLAGLDAMISGLPEGFGTVKAPDLNTEFAGEAKPVVVDVRTAEEIAADGAIEGSILVPVVELPARLAELPEDKATPIVVTCKSGHRGAMALLYLQSLGYTNVRNLAGGLNAWIAAELPVVK